MRSGRRMSLMEHAGRLAMGACTAALALSLATPMVHAETSGEVRNRAAQESEHLDELLVQLEEVKSEVDALDAQMDDLAQKSVQVQGKLIEDRAQLREVVSTSYRWGGIPNLWQIALSCETVEDFVSRIYYTGAVTKWHTESVEELNEDKRELDEHMDKISVVRSNRRQALDDLQETCDELQTSVEVLLEYADGLETQERAVEKERLAGIARQATYEEQRVQERYVQVQGESDARALAQQASDDPKSLEARAAEDDARAAEAKAAAQKEGSATAGSSGESGAKVGSVDGTAQSPESGVAQSTAKDGVQGEASSTEKPAAEKPAEEKPAEEQQTVAETPETQAQPVSDEGTREQVPAESQQSPAAAEPTQESSSDSGGDWVECIASAYTAYDNSPSGSFETASGIPLDDSVPTVALPIAMDPARYYGSQVQIEYDGMTVIATVTDCGGMGGGSRGLDLTPAVFQAFGAETGDDWGLRDVRYRFL